MLNRSASLAMSTSVLKALPGKLDIKRHSPSILYLWHNRHSEVVGRDILGVDITTPTQTNDEQMCLEKD